LKFRIPQIPNTWCLLRSVQVNKSRRKALEIQTKILYSKILITSPQVNNFSATFFI
jgi:hypothetical protein